MDEGDACAPSTGSRLGVDETGPVGSKVFQRRTDIGDGKRNVMKTLTLLGQELSHRGFRPQRLQQLDEGAADGNHRLIDPLLGHHLPIERLHPVAAPVVLDGRVQVRHGDPHVIEVEQLHRAEGIGPNGGWHHIAVTIGAW